MENHNLSRAHEQCLRDQAITADQPGTVLRDFQVLLDFLKPAGVEAGGKHHVLPLKFIGELDLRLSRPLNLKLQRPQLRSHPYLQGLNLLLRASGLSRVEGSGAKARLVLDQAMLSQWDGLNPTERYFNLLEAWLRFGRAEMVGERQTLWEGLLFPCLQTWQYIPENGRQFDIEHPQDIYLHGIGRNFYLLALLDMFGLMQIEQPCQPVTPWSPAGVQHVPFGDAVLTLLVSRIHPTLAVDLLRDENQEELATEERQFGAWQPAFRPFFPEWGANLKLPASGPREGTFIFRVSVGKVWRLIALPAEDSLDDLVSWILRSVEFDSDHLYSFEYRDRLGAVISINHPAMDEGPWADRIPVGTLPLGPGETMKLEYDFGDCWRFTVKLDRIEPPGTKLKAPRILEKHGASPEQYPNWDE